eukprot:Sspe_Gene.44821::Locus_22051_Transcript_1_1_Confidence_1.000_Length_1451::g.44821::m.44821
MPTDHRHGPSRSFGWQAPCQSPAHSRAALHLSLDYTALAAILAALPSVWTAGIAWLSKVLKDHSPERLGVLRAQRDAHGDQRVHTPSVAQGVVQHPHLYPLRCQLLLHEPPQHLMVVDSRELPKVEYLKDHLPILSLPSDFVRLGKTQIPVVNVIRNTGVLHSELLVHPLLPQPVLAFFEYLVHIGFLVAVCGHRCLHSTGSHTGSLGLPVTNPLRHLLSSQLLLMQGSHSDGHALPLHHASFDKVLVGELLNSIRHVLVVQEVQCQRSRVGSFLRGQPQLLQGLMVIKQLPPQQEALSRHRLPSPHLDQSLDVEDRAVRAYQVVRFLKLARHARLVVANVETHPPFPLRPPMKYRDC